MLLAKSDGVKDNLFGYLIGASFDHDDAVSGTGDHHIKRAFIPRLVSWIQDPFPANLADANAGNWPSPGNFRQGKHERSGHERDDIRVVFPVKRQDSKDHLD